MVPYKRPAADKSGVPVYQPNATTYQQLMQLQQPFVPVSCEYSTSPIPQQQSSSTCASPCLSDTAQSVPPQQNQTPPLPQQVAKKENDLIPSITTAAAVSTIPHQQPAIPDPAALAKEVAQQNYAKAIKLAAVNQSLVANSTLVASQFSHLNPLNYTGISLNKQTLALPPPAAAAAAAAFPRYPTLPFQFNAAATSFNLGLANPYQAAIAQQNLLNISRPPPNLHLNPYALIRPTYATTAAAATAPIYGNSFLNAAAQYPVTVSAAPITNVSSGVPVTTNIAVAPATPNNNNNNVVLQPYKKLKTT